MHGDIQTAVGSYAAFLENKTQIEGDHGFRVGDLPDWLFPFQRHLVEWALAKGRAAIFADCGLGKTPMQLVWGDRVVRHTNKPVLALTPLAVGPQTVREAEKFGIDAVHCRDGKFTGNRVVVTNYERLHYFDPNDFGGAICDESSILKNFDGTRKAAITEFMRKMRFRLLCTATAAPNDYTELGTSSEALGYLGYMDMLGQFFKNDQGSLHSSHGSHGIFDGGKWRFKPHAERDFWRWLCSWARAIRKPSDLGFDDGDFQLPELTTTTHIVNASRPLDGMLFSMPAVGLAEQRKERSATVTERCERVAELVPTDDFCVSWAYLNSEADLLEKLIPDAVQVSGRDSDDEKEEKFEAFQSGQIKTFITKPVIGAFGLNWQHCNRMTLFPSHSFEQYYQASDDHNEYQAKQDAATIASLKAVLELAESELKMLYKKTGVSGDRISRMIEGMMKEQLRSGLVRALEERSRLDPHAPDAIVIPSKTREGVVK